MAEPDPASVADLARIRANIELRHRLLADNLEQLLHALNNLRGNRVVRTAERERQIREGMALAVKLAGLLQEMTEGDGDDPPAA